MLRVGDEADSWSRKWRVVDARRVIKNLFDEQVSQNLEEVWNVVGTFVWTAACPADQCLFWIACVRKAVKLLKGRDLPTSVIPFVISTCHWLVKIAEQFPDLKENAIQCFSDQSDIQCEKLEVFQRASIVIPPFLSVFEKLKGIYGWQSPSFDDVVRKSMAFAAVDLDVAIEPALELNDETGGFTHAFVLRAYLEIFGGWDANNRAQTNGNGLDRYRPPKVDFNIEEGNILSFFTNLVGGCYQDKEINEIVQQKEKYGSCPCFSILQEWVKPPGKESEATEPKSVVTVEEMSKCSDPKILAEWLNILDILSIPESEMKTMEVFWTKKAREFLNAVSQMGHTQTAIGYLALVCRKAVSMFQAFKSDIVLSALVDPQFELPSLELPKDYPVRETPLCRPGQIGPLFKFLDEMGLIPWDNVQQLVWRFLLFSIISVDAKVDCVLAHNTDFQWGIAKIEDVPEMTVENVLPFCALRWIFGKVTQRDIQLDVSLGLEKLPTTKMLSEVQPGVFVYCAIPPVPFNEEYPENILLLGILTGGVILPPPGHPITRKLVLANLAFSVPVLSSLTEGTIKLGLMTCIECMSETERLVFLSKNGNKDATIALLSRPECLPSLSDKLVSHRLLRMFLSKPQGTELFDVSSFDSSVEGLARLCWSKLPEDRDTCEVIFKKLLEEVDKFMTSTVSDQPYASKFCGRRNPAKYLSTPKDFLSQSYWCMIDCVMSALVVLVTHLKQHGIDSIIAPETYSDLYLNEYAPKELQDVTGPPLPEVEINWHMANYRGSKIIRPQWSLEITKTVFSYFVAQCDRRVVDAMMPDDVKLISCLGGDILLDTLVLVSEKHRGKLLDAMEKCGEKKCVTWLWKLLARYEVLPSLLFEKMEVTSQTAIAIVDAMPATFSPTFTSYSFVQIFSNLVRHIPVVHPEVKSSDENKSSPMNWVEDKVPEKTVATNTAQGVNLWAGRPVPVGCQKDCQAETIAFVCCDCSRRSKKEYLCLSCAMNCHKGHNITIEPVPGYNCKCSSICQCGVIPEVRPVVSVTANPVKIAKVFECLAWHREQKQADKVVKVATQLSPRLGTKDIRRMPLDLKTNHTSGRILFKRTGKRVVDTRSIQDKYTGGDLRGSLNSRNAWAPLGLCAYAGGLLFVADAKQIVIYRMEEFSQVGRIQLEHPALFIRARQSVEHGVLLGVGEWKAIEVFAIGEDASVSRIHNRGCSSSSNNYIISVDWLNENTFVVLWREALEMYRVPDDGESWRPFRSWNSSDSNFTSCICFGGDKVMAALGVGIMFVVSTDETRPLEELPPIRWSVRYSGIIISASIESNILCLTAPGVGPQVARFEESSRPGVEIRRCNDMFVERRVCELKFCATYPGCPSILIFAQPSTGQLFSIEYTESQVEVTNLTRNFEAFQTHQNNQRTYGWFKTENSFFCIDASGELCELLPRGPGDTDEQQIVVECEGPEYRVPPTFWVDSEMATHDTTHMTGTDETQNYNTLYRDDIAFFHTNVPRKVLSFHVSNKDDCIVGIRLWFGDYERYCRPDYIVIKGRKYDTSEDHTYVFPLMPSEVKPGERVDIFFPNSTEARPHDYHLQGATIFVKKFSEIAAFLESPNETLRVRKSLLDFSEIGLSPPSDGVALLKWMQRIPVCEDHKNIPRESLKALIRGMYRSGDASPIYRAAIARIAHFNQEVVTKVWAETISEMLAEKAIGAGDWGTLWEDYILFDPEIQHKICVWDGEPQIGPVGSFIAAFMCDE